jgi:hypothetical protein
MNEDKRPLALLTQRYPQLTLAVEAGMSQSDEYKAITQRGRMPVVLPYTFSDCTATELYTEHTEAGDVEILVLPDRGDFVRFVQVMAYRCEPRVIRVCRSRREDRASRRLLILFYAIWRRASSANLPSRAINSS